MLSKGFGFGGSGSGPGPGPGFGFANKIMRTINPTMSKKIKSPIIHFLRLDFQVGWGEAP